MVETRTRPQGGGWPSLTTGLPEHLAKFTLERGGDTDRHIQALLCGMEQGLSWLLSDGSSRASATRVCHAWVGGSRFFPAAWRQ